MRVRLVDPSWISPPGRVGLGISFRCPVCVAEPHHVFCWFSNPVDGEAQLESEGEVFFHTRDPFTSGLGTLTLLEPIRLPCWEGVLVDGELLEQ